jgi:hypothetical protein
MMTRTAGAIGRLFAALFVCLLVAPSIAHAAQRSVVADFDGDGYHDHATLDDLEPSVLRVWLSATRSTAVVRSRSPFFSIAAKDLDGDRRAELIAGARATGLQVWTSLHAAFSRFQPRPVPPGGLHRPVRHKVDDAPERLPAAVTPATASIDALLLIPQPRAPATDARALIDPRAAAPHSRPTNSPLAPRPPPVSR